MKGATHAVEVELPTGSVIGGRFRIVGTLGRGGMATVYRAEHQVTRQTVALKVMSERLCTDGALVSRFLREARMAATIQHENAIKVMDAFQDQSGLPVMVMELLEGESLAERLERGRISAGEAARILVPVLDALSTAHAMGIVHRDLKPDNIFMQAREGGSVVPKVLDFGIAKVVSDNAIDPQTMQLTSTGMMLGTPNYMSPEQVGGRADIDHRSDIWAVGVVLYEAFTGVRPFFGQNFGQLFVQILQAEPKAIDELVDDVPEPLVKLVRSCMAKRPEERPPSCSEVARILSPHLSDTIVGHPLPPARVSQPTEASPSGVHMRTDVNTVDFEAPTVASEQMAVPSAAQVERPGRGRIVGLAAAAAAVLAIAGGVAALVAWPTDDAAPSETAPPVVPLGPVTTTTPPTTPPEPEQAAEPEPEAGESTAGPEEAAVEEPSTMESAPEPTETARERRRRRAGLRMRRAMMVVPPAPPEPQPAMARPTGLIDTYE